MGQYNKAIITAAGENLVARAVAGELKLNITKAKISDHRYPDGTDYKALTDMDGVKQVLDSPETKVLYNNMIQTRVLFSNEDIQAAYYIQNIGLYAKDGEEEILFCIVTAETPDEMPKYNGVASTSYIYNIQNVVQDAAEINIEVVPSGTATIQDVMERVGATGGNISETVIETLEPFNTKYPVPLAGETAKVFMGKVKKYIEDTKPLEADMTIYVATTGSNTTGDGTIGNPYKTIQYALSKVPKDLGGYTATVNVADGTYNESISIAGYNAGYLILKRNGIQELNELCNIKSIRVEFCGNVSVSGLNFTNTDGTSVYANVCEFVDIGYCQSIVATIADETSFYFSCVSVGRIGDCRSLNHDTCLRTYLSNVVSYNWAGESLGKSYGIVSDGGRVTNANTFQPKGLIAQDNKAIGGIIVSNYGAIIGTLRTDTTLYVATTGSDTTGDGTSAKPYRTIQYALNILPKDLGSLTATVFIANGTYDENLDIYGFINGKLLIRSNTESVDNSVIIKSIHAFHCACDLWIQGVTIAETTSQNAIIADVVKSLTINYTSITSSNLLKTCILAWESIIHVANSRLSNHAHAIYAGQNCNIYSNSNTGSGNNIGICSAAGGKISCSGTQPTGIRDTATVTGGVIFQSNGTQISGLITSGLSCTWGAISGGYVRHGNMNGAAMVTLQLKITITTPLSGGTEYNITGFPQPVITPAVTVHDNNVQYAQINNPSGTLWYRPLNAVGTGYNLMMSCTYLTNS